MSAKITSSKNGISYDDSDTYNLSPEHYCPHAEKIIKTDRRMNGTDDEPGIFSDVKQILKNQENNKAWLRGSVFAFGVTVLMLFYFGITDHNKIQEFPDTYLAKSILTQVIMELKQQTAIMTKIVNSPNLDSLMVYRRELNIIQQNSGFDRMMRATRGGVVTGKKEVMTDAEFKDKLKEMDEKLLYD